MYIDGTKTCVIFKRTQLKRNATCSRALYDVGIYLYIHCIYVYVIIYNIRLSIYGTIDKFEHSVVDDRQENHLKSAIYIIYRYILRSLIIILYQREML